jgi:hypothetical protein
MRKMHHRTQTKTVIDGWIDRSHSSWRLISVPSSSSSSWWSAITAGNFVGNKKKKLDPNHISVCMLGEEEEEETEATRDRETRVGGEKKLKYNNNKEAP